MKHPIFTRTRLLEDAARWAAAHPERPPRPPQRGRRKPKVMPPSAEEIASAVVAKMPRNKAVSPAAYLTAKNSLAVMGQEWPWVLRTAATLGVPVLGAGKKKLVNLASFSAALEGSARLAAAQSRPETPEAAAVVVRRALGRL